MASRSKILAIFFGENNAVGVKIGNSAVDALRDMYKRLGYSKQAAIHARQFGRQLQERGSLPYHRRRDISEHNIAARRVLWRKL
jgi:hypothetical protein